MNPTGHKPSCSTCDYIGGDRARAKQHQQVSANRLGYQHAS